jgi:hypothetical protein
MSDSLPENSFGGSLKVVKLISGEEIVGLVCELQPDIIQIKLPAMLENYLNRDPSSGEMVEYVKLTNYLANVRGFEVNLPKSVIIYMGMPTLELEKMYEVFFVTMQEDPKAIIGNSPSNSESGLQLLNDLFTNEDFVNFVNDLIDNFEEAEILIEDEDEDASFDAESSINDSTTTDELDPQPKPKKRNKAKPESKKLPYNPESPVEDAESWSDNPNDYL